MGEPASTAVIVIGEPDYRYGRGVLRLRVDRVDTGHPVVFDREAWLWVEGTQVTADGVDIKPRRALVRARCLPPQLRKPLTQARAKQDPT